MTKRTRRGDPQKQAYWEAVVRRWRGGSQSVRAFCRAEGLRESAFYFWRRELARRGQPSHAKRAPDAARGSRCQARSAMTSSRLPRPGSRLVPGPTPSFLPVHVVAASGCSGVTEERHPLAGGGVEIILTQGRAVRVQAGFDRQTLAEVLAVLEAEPC